MIEVKNVNKTFYPGTRKEQKVLENASLSLPDQGLVCIVGPSGSGKSTILNAIGGLISYDGKILYDGNEVKIEEYRRNHIGYIFQDFLLFENLSIRDNIKIGLHLASVYDEKEVSRRTEILLKAVSLNVNSSRPVRALSLGQKQRVGIARALANSPKILLADEPTGNLDSKNSLRIMDILKSLSKERLVIVVTHNMSLVNLYADQAYQLVNRGFTPINPKGEEISQVYEEETKNVSYHKEEGTIGELSISFYSESDKANRKITIVERNGKLLISGENVALVSKEEIQPIVDKVNAKASVPEKKEESVLEDKSLEITKAEEKPSSVDETPLTFEPRKDKKPLREHSFFLSLFHRNPLSQTKYKGKTGFRVMEIVLPLIAFFFFNLYYASVATSSNLISNYFLEDNLIMGHYTAEKAEKVKKTPKSGTVISLEDYLSWDPEDSALVSAPFDSPIGTKGGSMYSISYRNSYLSLPEFYLLYSNGDSYHYTSYSNGSKLPEGIFPIEDYKTFYPEELGKYDLLDDEVLVDVSLLDSSDKARVQNEKNVTISFFDNILESLTDSQQISRLDLTPYQTMIQYKVKGFVDTGIQAIYAPKKMADIAKMISFASTRNDFYSYSTNYYFAPGIACFPSLKDVTFYRYDEHSSDSNLLYSDLSSVGSVDQSSYLSSFNRKLYDDGLPYVILSDSAKKMWNFYTADNGVIYNPSFIADTGKVTSESHADKKVMVFKTAKYNEKTLDSYAEFFRYLVVEKLLCNFVVDDSYDEEDKNAANFVLHLPEGLEKAFPGAQFALQEDEYSSVLKSFDRSGDSVDASGADYGYYLKNVEIGSSVKDATIDAPIHISRYSFIRLLCSFRHIDDLVSFSVFSDIGGEDMLSMAYSSGNFFLSSNPEKSIAYLNSKYQDQGVVFETVKSAKEQIAYTKLRSQAGIYLIVLVVLFFLFVLFTILDHVGKINSLRYNIGVERCLGASKSEVIFDSLGDAFASFITEALIPTLLLSLLLSLVELYYCGWMILLFFLFYLLIEVLSVLIPLLVLLAKKPADILRSLN